MPKLSETYSKWKSIRGGLLAVFLGSTAIRFGPQHREMGYQLLMGYFFLVSSWHLLSAGFRIKTSEKHFCNLGQAEWLRGSGPDSIILQDLASISLSCELPAVYEHH